MEKTKFLTIDELLSSQGTELGTTDWVEVTQDEMNKFADATHAHEWIHVDVERARTGPFGTTVAHGYLTLSLATRFVTELIGDESLGLGVNYGLDRVRFPAPVPVGSRLRAHGTLQNSEPYGEGARLVIKLVYEREGDERCPCIAEIITLILPVPGRPSDEEPDARER